MERAPSPPLPPDFTEPTTMRLKNLPPVQERHHAAQPPESIPRSETVRARASSRVAPILHQPQPVRDAVNSAFDQPLVQNQLDPELVRQVTEQVIRNLQATSATSTLQPSIQPQASQYGPPPPPQMSQASPPKTSTYNPADTAYSRPMYTPPTPDRYARREDSLGGSPSPERLPSDRNNRYSKESLRSRGSVRSRASSTANASQMDGMGLSGLSRSNTADQRRRGHVPLDDDRTRRKDSTSDNTTGDESRRYRRQSRDMETEHPNVSQSRVRPTRILSDVEETNLTSVEKNFGILFDPETGNPTGRLGQFLRGLALHLIEDYEPKDSLVISPAKMLRYFREVRLSDELYPWEVIFSGRITNQSLSTMYRNLSCQHHFIQASDREVPNVPALTPRGFETFMTILIQAHPDNEAERLQQALVDMPLSNAENRAQRFPKELSRRLLPLQPNIQAEQRIVASLAHEPLVQLRGAANMPPPPPQASAPTVQPSFAERERKPYAQTLFANAIDDDDLDIPLTMPIERERKPYSGKEGAGKTHDDEYERPRNNRPSPPSYKDAPLNVRSSRSNSGLPTQQPFSNGSDPMPIPSRSHRQSQGQGPPPAMLNGMNIAAVGGPGLKRRNTPPPRRQRTPPIKDPYARSEPLDLSQIPASQYASNLHPTSAGGFNSSRDPFAGNLNDSGNDDDNRRKYYRPRRASNDRERSTHKAPGSENDENSNSGRGYPIPPRPPPSSQNFATGGDTGYNASSSSNGFPPVGSYPRAAGFDARRSTWYGQGGANNNHSVNDNSGSDGYGSFANNTPGYPQSQQQQGMYGSFSRD
ncbi:hypothetical protein LTR62_007947 [Meristemomyces frigidus]|uniref:DUF7514 domain-containing protein n=1 Tax=Meristemomyces frigidus TaxID=1508187 RepID=A0AAN7TPD4_9PEZI|nr:hypothetical protein LTR62_007947 [Meristemomyces frigidus]